MYAPGERIPEGKIGDALWKRLTLLKAIETDNDPVEIATERAGEDEVLPPRNVSPAKAEPDEPEEADEADEAEEADEPEEDGVAEEADEPEEGDNGEELPALPLIDGADAIVATPKAAPKAAEKKPEAAKPKRSAKK